MSPDYSDKPTFFCQAMIKPSVKRYGLFWRKSADGWLVRTTMYSRLPNGSVEPTPLSEDRWFALREQARCHGVVTANSWEKSYNADPNADWVHVR